MLEDLQKLESSKKALPEKQPDQSKSRFPKTPSPIMTMIKITQRLLDSLAQAAEKVVEEVVEEGAVEEMPDNRTYRTNRQPPYFTNRQPTIATLGGTSRQI